jgi:hypothetical protein
MEDDDDDKENDSHPSNISQPRSSLSSMSASQREGKTEKNMSKPRDHIQDTISSYEMTHPYDAPVKLRRVL